MFNQLASGLELHSFVEDITAAWTRLACKICSKNLLEWKKKRFEKKWQIKSHLHHLDQTFLLKYIFLFLFFYFRKSNRFRYSLTQFFDFNLMLDSKSTNVSFTMAIVRNHVRNEYMDVENQAETSKLKCEILILQL